MSERERFYQNYKKSRDSWAMELETDPNRFVAIEQRHDTTVFPPDVLKTMLRGKLLTEWKGINMRKDSMDTTIYQMMIWKIKPATIFEIGAYKGASAMWLADHLRMFNIDGHVYSLDIDLSQLDERVERKGITFIEGDCNTIEESFPPQMLQALPHPWIIIEDSHVNVNNVLEHFNAHTKTGDYLIVEDTTTQTDLAGILEFDGNVAHSGAGKMKILRNFLERHSNDLMVDSFYTDMFGYNGTWNINGFVRKM